MKFRVEQTMYQAKSVEVSADWMKVVKYDGGKNGGAMLVFERKDGEERRTVAVFASGYWRSAQEQP